MTGSSYIPIVVPITAFLAMAFWLGLVFYADAHHGFQHRRALPRPDDETAGAADLAGGPGIAARPAIGEPAGPGDHERIDEHSSGALLG